MKRDYDNPLCADCDRHLFKMHEYAYMIHDVLWDVMLRKHRYRGFKASTFDMLCIGCLTSRLGRNLYRDDFNWDVPLNSNPDWKRSTRLKRSMTDFFLR